MRTPKNIYDYPCWADLDLKYCDSFCFGEGCNAKDYCKAYQTGRSADLNDDPDKKPYSNFPDEIEGRGRVPKETRVCEGVAQESKVSTTNEDSADFSQIEERIE